MHTHINYYTCKHQDAMLLTGVASEMSTMKDGAHTGLCRSDVKILILWDGTQGWQPF